MRDVKGPRLFACAVAVLCGTAVTIPATEHSDLFAFFSPWLTLSASEHTRLGRGEVIARALPAEDGQLAVFAAARFRGSPESLIAWTHAIEQLKHGPFVIAVRRFSAPPSVADLDSLTLDAADLDALRRCQPGNCDVKLAASEIAILRRAIVDAGIHWRDAAQNEFRRVLFARVTLYRSTGLGGLPAYADRMRPVLPADAFAGLLRQSPYLARGLPEFTAALVDGAIPYEPAESLTYWSKERFGAGKSVVSMTHVRMIRPQGHRLLPAVLVAGTQLFSSHYTVAGLGITSVFCGTAEGCYLVYISRTQTDVLGGVLGGVKRALVTRRIESETPAIVAQLRRRLEGGLPQQPMPERVGEASSD